MKSYTLKTLIVSPVVVFCFIFCIPLMNIASAQTGANTTINTTYNLLTPLPSGTNNTTSSVDATNPIAYIQSLFRIIVSLAVVLCVFMLVYAGIVYMTTDAIKVKQNGKMIIQRTLWGLLLLLISYLIIETVNPNALNLGAIFSTNITGGAAWNTAVTTNTTTNTATVNTTTGTGGTGGTGAKFKTTYTELNPADNTSKLLTKLYTDKAACVNDEAAIHNSATFNGFVDICVAI